MLENNEVNIDYEMIDKFFKLIANGNPDILEKIDNIKTKVEALNDEINILKAENEKYIDEIYDKFIDFRIEHYNKNMEEVLKHLENSIIEEFDEMFVIPNEERPNEERPCNEVFEEIIENRGTENDYINYINNVVSSNGSFDNKKQEICNEINVDYSIIKKFYNDMIDIKKIADDKYKEWNEVRLPRFLKEIDDNQPLIRVNKNIQYCYDEAIKNITKILDKYRFLNMDEIDNLEDCPEDIKEILQNRLEEFEKFRYSHFNQEFEDILKNLDLQYINELNKNNIIENGTIEDYITYMKNYKSKEGVI